MEPVKVPQHLELEDVVAWGLGAVDLICVAAGGAVAWWIYEFLPAGLDVRLGAAAPFAFLGLALGIVRLRDLTLRAWLLLTLSFIWRPRRLLLGGSQ